MPQAGMRFVAGGRSVWQPAVSGGGCLGRRQWRGRHGGCVEPGRGGPQSLKRGLDAERTISRLQAGGWSKWQDRQGEAAGGNRERLWKGTWVLRGLCLWQERDLATEQKENVERTCGGSVSV